MELCFFSIVVNTMCFSLYFHFYLINNCLFFNLMKIQSSDDESLAEEEEEVIRLQKEKAKTFSLEDFGLEDERDRELTLEVLASAFVLSC